MVIANKGTTRDAFTLDIVVWGDPNIFLESQLAYPSVFRMQYVIASEIVSGNDALDRVTKKSNIGGRLR